jgi:hypothetical protein
MGRGSPVRPWPNQCRFYADRRSLSPTGKVSDLGRSGDRRIRAVAVAHSGRSASVEKTQSKKRTCSGEFLRRTASNRCIRFCRKPPKDDSANAVFDDALRCCRVECGTLLRMEKLSSTESRKVPLVVHRPVLQYEVKEQNPRWPYRPDRTSSLISDRQVVGGAVLLEIVPVVVSMQLIS